MDENIRTILSVTIPAFVTIIGFVVTYFKNKRYFREELRKAKTNIQLDKISEVPYEILSLFNKVHDTSISDKEKIESYNNLLASIIAYGSKEAIAIAAAMQEFLYINSLNGKLINPEPYKLMAYNALLLCQVKYDLTGTEVNPEYWYRIKFTDYRTKKSEYQSSVNKIVGELSLNKFMSIH